MTTAADDAVDTAVEAAFEAYLAGRPVPEGDTGPIGSAVAFADAARATATRPGRPNAALAELLATGLLADQSSPSVRTAPTAGKAAAPRGRRRPMFVITILAKIASAGAVAQAAAGAGIAAVVFTTAGAAGVLPDGIQATVFGIEDAAAEDESDADTGTEEEAPAPEVIPVVDDQEGAGEGSGDADDAADDGAVQDPAEEVPVPVTEDAQTGDAEQAAAEYRNHGQRVSEAARDDVPNREQMSTVAHANRDQKRAASSPETPETPEVEVEDEVEDADNHSRGGNGGGNGGKGGGKGR